MTGEQLTLRGAMAAVLLAAAPAAAQPARVRIEARSTARGGWTVLDSSGGLLRVDAGPVDALGLRRPRSGRYVRWRHGGGAFIVWSFRAVVGRVRGTARFELQAVSGTPVRLRYAVGDAVAWDAPASGTPLPQLGTAVVHPALLDGQVLAFDVALPIRDADRAGLVKASLRYALVENGLDLARPHRLPTSVPSPIAPFEHLPRLPPGVPRGAQRP